MKLYSESSAVLAWLLGERSGEQVRRLLEAARLVVVSELALVECRRVLVRALTNGEIREADSVDRQALLNRVCNHWVVYPLDSEVLERADRPFPKEPIRTLDALHVATALAARKSAPQLGLLSLDDRIRRNAESLGFQVQPA